MAVMKKQFIRPRNSKKKNHSLRTSLDYLYPQGEKIRAQTHHSVSSCEKNERKCYTTHVLWHT